ncbi:MAG: hypothetical protein IPN42_15300 [Methylococcaceae bacterium]|nr:hypothetical protein [Methylococcaceae bacterium]
MNTKTLKTISIAATLFAIMGAASTAHSAVPTVETIGRAAITSCPTIAPTAQVYHSDKIVFIIGNGVLQPLIAADFAVLNALPRLTELDVKIRDNPNAVAALKAKLLFFLGAANTDANRNLIRITDVEYAVAVCPKAP